MGSFIKSIILIPFKIVAKALTLAGATVGGVIKAAIGVVSLVIKRGLGGIFGGLFGTLKGLLGIKKRGK